MQELHILYQDIPDRWITGDRMIRGFARRWLRPRSTHLSGMRRVVRNFLTGLEKRRIAYRLNASRFRIARHTPVISFGMGRLGVKGLPSGTPLIAAIGFPYPAEFPELDQQYDLRLFLQHSKWTLDLVRAANEYDQKVFRLWHAGIDTEYWRPTDRQRVKPNSILLYDKISWERSHWESDLIWPIKQYLKGMGYAIHTITYGSYTPSEYKSVLQTVSAAIFLSPHESQGFAYQECLACDVPVLAWNPGKWLDPLRFSYGLDEVPATSVPFFDQRCGNTFVDFSQFTEVIEEFLKGSGARVYRPRQFVLENLTIDSSTVRMLKLLKDA